jgi:hypothetical protein
MITDEHRVPSGKARFSINLPRIKVSLFWGILILWLVAACAPLTGSPPPPAPVYPTRVITQDGMAYMVNQFRLPGTRQELTLRYDGTRQWIALNLLRYLTFKGPVRESYREAEIILLSGEKMQTEVFVNIIVEGNTDLGYWNMPLSRIERLDLGSD